MTIYCHQCGRVVDTTKNGNMFFNKFFCSRQHRSSYMLGRKRRNFILRYFARYLGGHREHSLRVRL